MAARGRPVRAWQTRWGRISRITAGALAAIGEGVAAHVCGVGVQLTRPRSEPPIVRQAIEITGATEPPLFVTDVREGTGAGAASGSLISLLRVTSIIRSDREGDISGYA
jgi:hypothetical protein